MGKSTKYKAVRISLFMFDTVYDRIAWIPEYFAEVGNYLSFDDPRIWRYGWRVNTVYEPAKSVDEIESTTYAVFDRVYKI